ncbi:MAG TPA: insulinase family protein, partial [bacterium]|nr:insulinase family protein [bacterium]
MIVNKPSSRWREAVLALGTVLALAALAGCQVREHVPSSLRVLLNPQRQSLQYRRLVLPNQLRVILVSDPTAERSAAAMTVGAGSLEDPPDHQGMAHFLEHMLFLGTEKYPEPGSYQAFMASHAGYSNAFTADDHTTFFFQVADAAYPEALDRFSQFFIAPTFAQEYAQRELNAVASEHAKNMEDDFWRVRQIQRDQFNPAHPIHQFGTGNVATLRGVGQQALRAFYEREYSANRMTLALVGSASLDALERLARQHFGAVANRNLPELHYPQTILAPQPALRLLTVDPVRDVRSLTMEFPLPPVQQLYRTKPLDLIGFVLGHEGKGSLLSALKAQGLATSLSAGEDEGTRDYASFSIT